MAPGTTVERHRLARRQGAETSRSTLGKLPATSSRPRPIADAGDGPTQPASLDDFGLTVAPAEDGRGVVVTDVDPTAHAAERGLQAGDVILSVNGKRRCKSPPMSRRAVADATKAGRKAVLLQVEPATSSRFVALPVARADGAPVRPTVETGQRVTRAAFRRRSSGGRPGTRPPSCP